MQLNLKDMNSKYKKKVFYILIIDRESNDHVRLRNVINRIVPQCFIESIYKEEQAISYFNNIKIAPNLIFLAMDMQKTVLRLTIYMIRKSDFLKNVPLVLLNSDTNLAQRRELKFLGVNEFYTDINNPIEMRVIANDIKNRWLMPKLM